jgi:hypothetical protein
MHEGIPKHMLLSTAAAQCLHECMLDSALCYSGRSVHASLLLA